MAGTEALELRASHMALASITVWYGLPNNSLKPTRLAGGKEWCLACGLAGARMGELARAAERLSSRPLGAVFSHSEYSSLGAPIIPFDKGESMSQQEPGTHDAASASADSPPSADGGALSSRSLWAVRGVEDVYFQRQAQVSWWSIMGGIAAGALLTQLVPLLHEVQAGNWHLILYYGASALMIVIAWLTTVWASLILWWPIVPLHVLLVFLTGFTTSIICLFPTSPALWFGAASLNIFAGLLLEMYDLKANTWRAFPKEAISRSKMTMVIHAVLLLIAVSGSIALQRYPSRAMELTWGIVAVLGAAVGLLVQHLNMKRERELAGIP